MNWREVLTTEKRKGYQKGAFWVTDVKAFLAAADEADASAELLKPLPCGHPAVCAHVPEHEGATGYCRWCAEVAAKQALVEQLADALKDCRDDLQSFVYGEKCEHAVDICWCRQHAAICKADAALEAAGRHHDAY